MIFLRRYKKYIIKNVIWYFNCAVNTKAINGVTLGIIQTPSYITFIYSRRIIDLYIKVMEIHVYKPFHMVKNIPVYYGYLDCVLYAKFKHMNLSCKMTLNDMFVLKYFGAQKFKYVS